MIEAEVTSCPVVFSEGCFLTEEVGGLTGYQHIPSDTAAKTKLIAEFDTVCESHSFYCRIK